MSSQKPTKRKVLGSIDPGMATVIAAGFALIGTFLTVLLPRLPGPSATPNVAPTPTAAPAVIVITAAPTIAPEPTGVAGPDPTVQNTPAPYVVALLPPAQRESVLETGRGVLQMSKALPAILTDTFDNNDNEWPKGAGTYPGGIECAAGIEDGAFRITAKSTAVQASCYGAMFRSASNFAISADLTLENNRTATASLSYRISPDNQRYYYVSFQPANQTFATGLYADGADHPIITYNYTPEIRTEGANRLTVIAINNLHSIYFNDNMVATFTDDRLAQGHFALQLFLQEPRETETLRADNFEYRGQ